MKARLTHNLGLKILAFLLAILLWLVVVNIDDPISSRTYTNIPVSVINAEVLAEEQQTYQIVDGTQDVSVTVTARRQILDDITSEDITAVADMRELTLKTQIPISVTVNDFAGEYESAVASPVNLQVKLEEEETKKFPIVPITTGTVRDGYVLGELSAQPEKVTIRGPKSVVDQINRVGAIVNVSGLSSDTILSSELTLYDDDNNEIDQALLTNNLGEEGVSVSVSLYNTKNVPVQFDTSMISAAEGYSFEGITYEPENIQISGSSEQLEKVSEINIPAQALAMDDVEERTEQIVDITQYLPDGIRLAEENAGSVVVTVNVDKDGSRTYDVMLSAITVDHLSDDLIMFYETVDALAVQVQGPKDALDNFEPEKVTSIDLAAYTTPGTYTVPVEIKVPEDCILESQVEVEIRLEEKETETEEVQE